MTARLSDIADQAGVSEATVSRAVNSKPGVSPATCQAVVRMTVLAQRMRAQRLSHRAGSLDELLDSVFALQAQDVPALRLAARARGVESLDGDAIRTWAMRGTLHLLHRDDLWVIGLLGPVFVAAGKRRRTQLGLTDDLCARAVPALREVLTEPLERPELVARLTEVGIALDPKSQAPAHLLAFAAHSGVLCRGLDDTYRLLGDLPEPGTVERLWRRYRRAYGPATVADFVTWSGLPKRMVRDLPDVADEPADPDGTVRMLGHFDSYLLGYRDRSLALDPRHAPLIQTGGGFLTPHVVVDGRVVAVWKRTGDGFEVRPFADRPDLAAESAELARFLGVGADLTWR
ncbi:AcrR family transcriptional regulator [Saccharothrix tamanrassetensis]|uniref:AcrR family transcriptional regulator n=1 Tax=Saccharothrix tamanrassetensis TaxID=1051531 RepID=A0A841CJK7_9PSEU|nr:crosslink repair DNA glycosylase YcaQ family protein [Saccharothrix tamanrassetensis]MBB5957661.1 AcrR family transcriptional regulator [Saccharothrix tamanrassetensis]